MGATIPVLTQALSQDLDDATRVHARIYAFNTLGAVAGALGGGYLILPWLGLNGALQAMALINLAVGAAFVLMAPRAGELPDSALPCADEPEAEAQPGPSLRSYVLIALLVGFAMMTLQTVVIRVSGWRSDLLPTPSPSSSRFSSSGSHSGASRSVRYPACRGARSPSTSGSSSDCSLGSSSSWSGCPGSSSSCSGSSRIRPSRRSTCTNGRASSSSC